MFQSQISADVEEEIPPSSEILRKGMEHVEDILNNADLMSEHSEYVQPVQSDILTSEENGYQIPIGSES